MDEVRAQCTNKRKGRIYNYIYIINRGRERRCENTIFADDSKDEFS